MAGESEPYPRQGIVSSPSLITECLCGRRHVDTLRDIMEEAHQAFEESRSRLDALSREVDRSRDRVDVESEDQVEAFRRLLEAKQQADTVMFEETLPADQTATRRYNAAVESYNRSCAGRPLDPVVMAEVQESLTCAPLP
jgi:hypothetical protein